MDFTNIGQGGIARDMGEGKFFGETLEFDVVGKNMDLDDGSWLYNEESLKGRLLFDIVLHFATYLWQTCPDGCLQNQQQVLQQVLQQVSTGLRSLFESSFKQFRPNSVWLERFLGFANFDLLARQLLFFSTKEYAKHLTYAYRSFPVSVNDPPGNEEGLEFLSQHIFPKANVTDFDSPFRRSGVSLQPNLPEEDYAHKGPLIGMWSRDGHNPDLGSVNGLFPITELIRTLYLFCFYTSIPDEMFYELNSSKAESQSTLKFPSKAERER